MMNQYITTGLKSNNYRFSACSLRLMFPVIVHMAACLQPHLSSKCGNGLVEEGEECDCGNRNICDYNDPCCTPSNVANNSADQPCTVRRSEGKACSPLSGSCCLMNCQVSRDSSLACDKATECHDHSLCNGHSGQCPPAAVKPNGTLCGGGARFCIAGQCVGNVCNTYGFLACRCTNPPGNRCKLCCKTNFTSKCLPAQKLGIVNKHRLPINLTAGEPCSDTFPAFCDKRHVCVPHLRSSATSAFQKSPTSWLKKHWPYLLVFLLALLFAVLFRLSSFRLKDAHMKSVQYGKMIGIFRIANTIGMRNMQNVAVTRYLFDRFQKKAAKGKLQMHFVEAISRLRTIFPTCPLSHITTAVSMASNEDVVVRMLLAQGFPIRRFIPVISESKFAHLSHLFPRAEVPLRSKNLIIATPEDTLSEHSGSTAGESDPLSGKESVLEDAITVNSAGTISIKHASNISVAQSSMGSEPDMAEEHVNTITKEASNFSSLCLKHFEAELSHSRQMLQKLARDSFSSQRSERTVYGSTKRPTDSHVQTKIGFLDKTTPLLTHQLRHRKTGFNSKHTKMRTCKMCGILKNTPCNVQNDEKSDAGEKKDEDDAVKQGVTIENDKDGQVEGVDETELPNTLLSGLRKLVISDLSSTRGRLYVSQNLFQSWFGQDTSTDDQKMIGLDPEQKEHSKPPCAQPKQNGKAISAVYTKRNEMNDGEVSLEIQPPSPPRKNIVSIPQPSTSQQPRIPAQQDVLHPRSITVQHSRSKHSRILSLLKPSDTQHLISFQDLSSSPGPSTSEQSHTHLNVYKQSCQEACPKESHGNVGNLYPVSSLVSWKEAHRTRRRATFNPKEDDLLSTTAFALDAAPISLKNVSYGMDFVDRVPQTMMSHRNTDRRKPYLRQTRKSHVFVKNHWKGSFSTKNPALEQFQ